jgi:type IV pilus assembly protein PilM
MFFWQGNRLVVHYESLLLFDILHKLSKHYNMSWFKPTSFLGVDIGAAGVKIVELKSEKKRPVLFTYGYTSEPQDIHNLFNVSNQPENTTLLKENHAEIRGAVDPLDERAHKYAAVIKEVCKQVKITAKAATVSLPVSALFHTIVTLPAVKPSEFDSLLKVEMKKLLPYSLEETALDYERIPQQPGSKVQQAVVNAVPKKLVNFYTTVFRLAGLRLTALEPESIALARSLVGRDTALSILVDVGAERTNFFIIDNARTITHQTIEVGGNKINRLLQEIWNVDPVLVEQMKRDLFYRMTFNPDETLLSEKVFLDMFSSVLDPIVKEIEYSLALYLEQTVNAGKRPEKIIVTGGAGFFPYLTSYLAEKFSMKCYVGDPWGRIVYQDGLKPSLNQVGPRMAVAIGLALRGLV